MPRFAFQEESLVAPWKRVEEGELGACCKSPDERHWSTRAGPWEGALQPAVSAPAVCFPPLPLPSLWATGWLSTALPVIGRECLGP